MTITTPPQLKTQRLMLTGHEVEDFEPLAAMWGDPVVMRHITNGATSTPGEAWRRMLAYRGLWSLLGYGYWAVRETASGRYIGDLGFADFQRAIPSIAEVPEAGWALVPSAQGKGYATEALDAALAWLDGHTGHRRSVCLISPDNAPSFHVAAKVGYANPAMASIGDKPVTILSRERR
jgi:RimJ/RimL family protein N-acetyltransferase